MTVSQRDKRALALLGAAIVISLAVSFWPGQEGAVRVVEAVPESIPLAEKRLARMRQIVATVPGKQKLADQVAGQVAEREKALLGGETAAQAQASLSQIVRQLARQQAPPIDIGQVEMGQIRPLGSDYGEALISVSMNCRIEQLVQLLADVTAQPELIATDDLRITAGDAKQKTVSVRLTVSGVLPRRLVPERKGGALF